MPCSMLLCLLFELHFLFILHPSCIIFLVHIFTSCLLFSLTFCLFVSKKGRVYFCYFYMTLVHILRGRNSISCAHLYGERYRCIYQGGEDIVLIRKLCFVCVSLCLFALWYFELCLVSMFCCSHCIVFVCWTCIHPYATMLYWLHVRMIICFAI